MKKWTISLSIIIWILINQPTGTKKSQGREGGKKKISITVSTTPDQGIVQLLIMRFFFQLLLHCFLLISILFLRKLTISKHQTIPQSVSSDSKSSSPPHQTNTNYTCASISLRFLPVERILLLIINDFQSGKRTLPDSHLIPLSPTDI